MANPNLVRKVATDEVAGEISKSDSIDLFSRQQNYIQNGNFDFWQRGTTSTSGGFQTADRWSAQVSGGTISQSRDTDMPTDPSTGLPYQGYSLKYQVTVAWAGSPAAGDFITMFHPIEGYNSTFLTEGSSILSFWCKTSVAGKYGVSLRNQATTRGFITEFEVIAANVWQFVEVAIPSETSTSGYDFTNGTGIRLQICLTSGSSFKVPSAYTAFQNIGGAPYIATNNQAHLGPTVGNNFKIARVMLNRGDVAAPFQRFGKNIDGELSTCQRYYEKSYNVDTPPGTPFTTEFCRDRAEAAEIAPVWFKVMKRATPSCVIYSPIGSAGFIRDVSVGIDRSASINASPGSHYGTSLSIGGGMPDGNAYTYHYTADAELS